MKKNLILILAAVLIVNVVSGVRDDPTTTTTTTTTTTPSTTTTTTSTTTVVTTTTTTPMTTTTTTTVAPITTTTTPSTDTVLNFTIPKNSSLPTCLRLKFSLAFEIKYIAEVNATKTNESALVTLNKYDDYDGICNDSINQFTLLFNENAWKVQFTYKLKNKNEYSLDTITLNYKADPIYFPNINDDDAGKEFTTTGSNLDEFSASKGNSFKCSAKTTVKLDANVTVDFKNYQGQPFISSESKSTDFDTAIECPADTAGTSKLVPIIVGSSLALLVLLVLIAYIIGRQKHRTGYQQV